MIILKGKYAEAKIFTDSVESSAQGQIIALLNQPFAKDSNVRIMPDVHAGKGCVIGFTAKMTDKVIPNLLGVDLYCGMHVTDITSIPLDLTRLDKFIHDEIPAGFHVHDKPLSGYKGYEKLYSYAHLRNQGNFGKAIGTLGAGNHFIEIGKSEKTDKVYLVIHSGSRNMGKQVAEYYQGVAVDEQKGFGDIKVFKKAAIESLNAQGKQKSIQKTLEDIRTKFEHTQPAYPPDLCFLTADNMRHYLADLVICQSYASFNRETMARNIIDFLGYDSENVTENASFETVHNYVNFTDGIMRKGAVSAHEGEELIIPLNMRDGSLLCIGKGNPDWNFSAPHGAGRLMSRSQAKKELEMPDYEVAMDGIYTTCVNPGTLDESPDAYKPMQEIIDNIGDTVFIYDTIKPLYNFKAGELQSR